MPWYFYSLISAISIAVTNLLTKRVSDKIDSYTMAWVRNALALPVLWTALLYSGTPQVNSSFWTAILIMLPFEIMVALLFFRAIKLSPLSLTIPITSFAPVLIAIGSFFILKERISYQLVFASLLLVLGAYILNLGKVSGRNLLKPFAALASEKGSLFMFLATILWGIYIPIGKIAIESSSSQYYAAIYFTLFVLLFTPIFVIKGKNKVKSIKESLIPLLLIGLFNGLFLISSSVAVSLGSMSIVNAFGTINIPLTVILAGTFLREKNILERLTATLVMTAGAIIAVVYG